MRTHVESIGDGIGFAGGGGAMWGVWIFAFLIIFFIVLIFMWRRNDEGGLEKYLPFLGMFAGKGFGKGHNDEEMRVEQARDTGDIIHKMDKNAQYLESKIDRNLIEAANDRIRSLEIKLAEEKSVALNKEVLAAIGRSEACTSHRFDMVEGKMMKKPEYFAYGAPQSFGFEGFPFHGQREACARG